MPDLAPRLPCPVCLGVTMDRVEVGPGGALVVDHCRRCGGAWLEHGEVQRLRVAGQAALWKRVEKRGYRFRMRCHDCHASLERADEACPACGWSNVLGCPACDRPMRVESHAGLRLDVCRECRGVWFDHHELEAVWGASFDQALQRRRLGRGG
ncbi:MAG TPA: zf-TFIIB domain-containing protein, partial [Longimicrobiaceae bacterium]|nr:zf-TFIIB domain-containing protein [Longimicrobiaceae bacterium]